MNLLMNVHQPIARQPRAGLVPVLLALWLLGCGTARRDEPLRPSAGQMSDVKLAQGQRVFAMHCYQCHPGGDTGLAPAMNDKPVPRWLLKTQVRAGLGAMPGFSEKEISDADLDALAAYLIDLRHTKVQVSAR